MTLFHSCLSWCSVAPHLFGYYYFHNLILSFIRICTLTLLSLMALFNPKPLLVSTALMCILTSTSLSFVEAAASKIHAVRGLWVFCLAWKPFAVISVKLFDIFTIFFCLTAYCKYHAVRWRFSPLVRIKVRVERLIPRDNCYVQLSLHFTFDLVFFFLFFPKCMTKKLMRANPRHECLHDPFLPVRNNHSLI